MPVITSCFYITPHPLQDTCGCAHVMEPVYAILHPKGFFWTHARPTNPKTPSETARRPLEHHHKSHAGQTSSCAHKAIIRVGISIIWHSALLCVTPSGCDSTMLHYKRKQQCDVQDGRLMGRMRVLGLARVLRDERELMNWYEWYAKKVLNAELWGNSSFKIHYTKKQNDMYVLCAYRCLW